MKTKLTRIFLLLAIFSVILSGAGIANAQLIYVPINSTASTSVWTSTSGSGTASSGTLSTTGCFSLSRDVYIGMRDSWTADISMLQTFLINRGYLSAGNATGYFGFMTRAAVMQFQAANGIYSTGYVGPLTRARIAAMSCNNGGGTVPPSNTYAPVITSLAPTYGPAGSSITIYGRNFTRTGNSVNFGGVNNMAVNIQSYDGVSIQFTIPYGPCPQNGLGIACPAIAYGSGQFPISVTNSNGTSNSLTFTMTSQNATNQPPTINGLDAPTTLSVGQQGTWTVRATDVTGGGLSYNVVWGDENQQYSGYYYTSSNVYTQSGTFTHTYNQPGTYNPSFTVRGSNGLTSQTSATVVVGSQTTFAPTITSVSPASGPVGTQVTVYGNNFSTYNNSINFAGKTNVVTGLTSYDGHTLRFTIPATPCSQGSVCAQVVLSPGTYPISVTNQNGTSNSINFNVTSGGSTGTINQTVTLSLNQTYTLGDLQIIPTQIIEDSRCPAGVYCIQAGKVTVRTSITINGAYTYGDLTAGVDSISVGGYTLRITDVSPLKTQGQAISLDQYRITYQVTK